ncbi:hypothetical protein FACS1894152_1700 [Bacilli bacterium]|nr:hypothetical protein FACS1894152_1700 [Bacilli bacterium]
MLYNITVEDFKNHFNRGQFSYSSEYGEDIVYSENDIVFYQMENYRSLLNNNIANEPSKSPEFWTLLPRKLYVLDSDIARAMIQAEGNFCSLLFNRTVEELYREYFLLLTAHYLLMDYGMVSNDLGDYSSSGVMVSKSIGGVSASYSLPNYMMEDPFFYELSKNPFGRKYLDYISKNRHGHIMVFQGYTNPN